MAKYASFGDPMRNLGEAQLRDVALTNFMLGRLRTLFGVHCEVYVKWPYGGAFNGAAYVCHGDDADVTFYGVDAEHEVVSTEAKIYGFSRGEAFVSWPSQEPEVITAILASADNSFPSLLASAPDLLHQVSRIQLWLIFNSTIGSAQAKVQSVADRITSLVGGASVNTDPYEFPPGSGAWNSDIEITLSDVMTEGEAHACLTDFFSRLEGSLFGVGADCQNHDGGGCSDADVQYCHVTGRQF